MKHLLRKYTQGLLFIACIVVMGCSDNEVPTRPCLPKQFPFEENSVVNISYDSKNRLYVLLYEIDGVVFQSFRFYIGNKLAQIDFKVNGIIAQDFVKVTHTEGKVKEEYYRGSAVAENLKSYRFYYLDENNRVTSYSERDKENLFVRGDSIVYHYTLDNVTEVKVYDADDVVVETYTITYDTNESPYYKSGFSGSEFIYTYLNQSKNNVLSVTHVELEETTTYTYTYTAKKFPLTRQSNIETEPREFKYTCDNL